MRQHECLGCGYRFQSVAMPVQFEALLEGAAQLTRKFCESRQRYEKKLNRSAALDRDLEQLKVRG